MLFPVPLNKLYGGLALLRIVDLPGSTTMAADQNVLAALYCALSNVFRRAIIDRSGGRSPHTGVVEQSIDSKSVSTADPDEDAISFRRSRSTSSCSSRSAATTASAEAVRGSPSPKSGGAEAFRNLKKRLGLGGGPQSAWKMFSAPRPALCSVSKNPYIILGVPREADEDTIRKAYKKLAVKHHPDKGRRWDHCVGFVTFVGRRRRAEESTTSWEPQTRYCISDSSYGDSS